MVDRTNYTIHIVYNLLHVMLDDNVLLYGPQIVMYYLYVYVAVESGIKQLNWIEIIIITMQTVLLKIIQPFWLVAKIQLKLCVAFVSTCQM